MKSIFSLIALMVGVFGTTGIALSQPGIVVTEVMSSGGTSDWFELTNMSDTLVYLDGYRMDDGSNSLLNSVALLGIDSILPWESVIFGESANPAVFIPTFLSYWDLPIVRIGTYSGSGVGLSSGGDGVNIFDVGGNLVSSVSFPAATAGTSFYWSWNWDGSLQSELHLNGLGIVSAPGLISQQNTYVNSNANPNTASPSTCIFPLAPNYGCMDVSACNYDSLANYESGLCIYPSVYFIDVDGDGFGNLLDSILSCEMPFGFIDNSADCNDTIASIKPNTSESCITAWDDNCDGLINVGCPPLHVEIKSQNDFIAVEENVGIHYLPIEISNGVMDSVQIVLSRSIYSDASENEDYISVDTIWIPAGFQGEYLVPIVVIEDNQSELAEKVIFRIQEVSQGVIESLHNYQIVFIKDNDQQEIVPTNQLQMELLGSYSNGESGFNSAEIVTYDALSHRLYIVNSVAARLDIVDFSFPANPVMINSVDLSAYGGINSVAVDQGRIAAAMEGLNPQENGSVLFLSADGEIVNQVQVGAMPDMICFSPDHNKLMTANEGEPNSDYSLDPLGSISIIDVSGEWNLVNQGNVITLDFINWNDSLLSLITSGVRIFGTNANVASDLEPEYIAISHDSQKAYVTLQENNAVAVVDLSDNTIEAIRALGGISYMNGNNAMDASDLSGEILITSQLPIRSTFMPDAISYAQIVNQGYLFTANEGDSREFGDIVDANRIGSGIFEMDSLAFPDQYILKNKKFLGRLNALKYSGDTDGDGDYDELHVLGGRSFSIWDANTGALVFDSKYLLEQITSESTVSESFFNASNALGMAVEKNRSDDKGPEPEGIVVKEIENRFFAFVALERVGGVVVFDVSNPTNPQFVTYANNRFGDAIGPDLGAEGIFFIADTISPNGKNMILLANEVSSTITVFQINTCSDLTPYSFEVSESYACDGDSLLVSILDTANYSVYWMSQSGQEMSQGDHYWVTNTEELYASIYNLDFGCSIQSPNFSLSFGTNFYQYQDGDSDGYGLEITEVFTCDTIMGYVQISGDCNDSIFDISPNAFEVCNEQDDNCDGAVDEGLGIVAFADLDGDGFGNPDGMGVFCVVPADFVENNWDCNDTSLMYFDFDGDSFGVDSLVSCGAFVIGDCDDDNFEINPDAIEIADNSVDEDCDGSMPNQISYLGIKSTVVFPNPTTGLIYSDGIGQFTAIYDTHGQLIREFVSPEENCDLRAMADGYYWLRLDSGIVVKVLKLD